MINITNSGQNYIYILMWWIEEHITSFLYSSPKWVALMMKKFQTNADWEIFPHILDLYLPNANVMVKTSGETVPDQRRLKRQGIWVQYMNPDWVLHQTSKTAKKDILGTIRKIRLRSVPLGSGWGNGGLNTFQGGGWEGEEPPIAWVQLLDQLVVLSSCLSSPTEITLFTL